MLHDDNLNCLLLTSFGPRTIIKGTRDKKNYTINKIFNLNNKKCNFLHLKNIVILRQRRSCTRNGHQLQTTKIHKTNYILCQQRQKIPAHTQTQISKNEDNPTSESCRAETVQTVVTMYLDVCNS